MRFFKISYSSRILSSDVALETGFVKIKSEITMQGLKTKQLNSESIININEKGISGFEFKNGKTHIKAICVKY